MVVVLKSTLKDSERKKLIETIKNPLAKMKEITEEEWGIKPMAYSIKGELAGYYYLFKLESEEAIPAGFEQKLLTNDNILRHLLLRTK